MSGRIALPALTMALAWSCAASAQEPAEFLNPTSLPAANGYSHTVRAPVGRTVYVSGQLPLDKDGNLVGADDFGAQAEQVFANLAAALAAAGASFDDVVKLNMYVTDMRQLKALRAARDRHINLKTPPASTLVEVERFVKDGAMVEIDATAVLSEGKRK